jgi:hypothetical protein
MSMESVAVHGMSWGRKWTYTIGWIYHRMCHTCSNILEKSRVITRAHGFGSNVKRSTLDWYFMRMSRRSNDSEN